MSDEEEVLEPTFAWIEDGHRLHFRIDGDSIHISFTECPHQGAASLCTRMRQHCVVDTFISIYGAELNGGSGSIDGPMEIAWTPVLGQSDLDNEFQQIWFVPIEDPDYRAFKILRGKTKEELE
jgi:hypothetical protein